MEDDLVKCLDELKLIRKYLIKKGKLRYQGNVIKNKLAETEKIFEKSSNIIQCITSKEIKPKSLTFIASISDEIKLYYSQIINLCSKPACHMSSSDSDSSETCSNPELKMEFDLKTACSLIPVMNNNENSIKGIIDSIEMYSDMLSSSGQKLLITFVLKSRLSQNAKLRMLPEYSSTKDLIKDLKNKLLVKKSPTAIQSRLQTVSQGYRTIEQFGTAIENLFADLTIAQADGDAEKYEIAARNYKHLNEAIQAAKDEELSAASSSRGEDVMHFSTRGRGKSYSHFNSHTRPQIRG
nr:uncharacterized protein LOC113402780 [Vanessa tameamea]